MLMLTSHTKCHNYMSPLTTKCIAWYCTLHHVHYNPRRPSRVITIAHEVIQDSLSAQ